MHRFLIIISLLVCTNVNANEEVIPSQSKWMFSIGGQQNWFIDNGYYEFSDAESSHEDSHKMGWEAGIIYNLSSFSRRVLLSLEYSDYGTFGANAGICIDEYSCVKRTEVQQSWFMANGYYLLDKNNGISFYAFAGTAYVLAEGKVLNESWDSNTIGFQGGFKILVDEPSLFTPYFGFRLSQFDLESDLDSASVYNASIILGAQF
jgi:opacity protein-like surface antigen